MNTVKAILPEDIQKEVTKSVLKKVIPFAAVEMFLISYILLWGEQSFKMVDLTVRLLIYVALVVLPIFIFKIHKLVADRSWKGEIIGINVEAGYDSTQKALFHVNYLILTVKREDGKIIERTVNAFCVRAALPTNVKSSHSSGKAEYAEDDYAIGDKVYHYYGLSHLLVVHNHNSRECVICGANNPQENDRCFYCGHSIIKKTF